MTFLFLFWVSLTFPEAFAKEGSHWNALKYSEAQLFMDKRKWPEAVIVLRSILETEPEFVQARLDLSKALAFLNRREEAVSLLIRDVHKEKDDRRRVLVRRARILSRIFFEENTQRNYQNGLENIRAGKYKAAIDDFSLALKKEPDHVEVLLRISQALLLSGDTESAVERLKMAKNLNPFEPEIRLWLGRGLYVTGEVNQAIEELKFAKMSMPKSELAAVWWAEALTASGQVDEALKGLDSVLEKTPLYLQVLLKKASLTFAHRSGDAVAMQSLAKMLQEGLDQMEHYKEVYKDFESEELGLILQRPEELKKQFETLKTSL